ncbi:spore cortex-lytic enzyme [Marinithermofilum abyssi]|uniref:Spore cortex-lytic enzyme n=1 Tax=Marinithermofilum abyssi TaxID=1571185 RepID=A0A8J2YEB3_9BACL|nr:spore cortex-lytic enzyme [Marinithermofilum abyssi]GGE20410.1 spore cortex-lytic enzyme [Marinithermofilum abyssi]
MKKWIVATFATVAVAALGAILPIGHADAHAASPTMIEYGSSNGDVWDLQHRLNKLGYSVKVDGIYGLDTEKSVIHFQKHNNLRIDGIAGPETWNALKKATDKSQTAQTQGQQFSLSAEDKQWLARAVHGEARGESFKGKVAVAAVILNRVESDKFPNTVKGVIMESGAFTAVDDGQIWLEPNDTAYKAVEAAAKGWDPSHGSLYYFNPKTATSDWIWSRPQVTQIGNHIFTK